MSTKQMLLATLVITTINILALAETLPLRQSPFSQQQIPSLRFIHTLAQEDSGYAQNATLSINIALMDTLILNKFKEVGKEKNFIICPCSIKGLPNKIRLYNSDSPFIDGFNPCEYLETEISNFSAEHFETLKQYFASTK